LNETFVTQARRTRPRVDREAVGRFWRTRGGPGGFSALSRRDGPVQSRNLPMKNRRASARHDATEIRGWLGLWPARDQFEARAARIENISLGGARLVLTTPPTLSQRVWLRAGTPICTECVQATVLEVRPRADGEFTVRLAFDFPCPNELLHTVANGTLPRPHFRRHPARLDKFGPLGELTHRDPDPIIARLPSRSRTSV
jgi:hypothetical protein